MDQSIPMETELCHNCKREVPQPNYLMHVVHCARNMAVCPVCGDAVPKAHLKEHRQKQHSLVECKDCRHKVQSGAMEHHKKSSCGKRVVPCPFCELELPKSEMADHENYCGSRTERCDECGELVMLKYQKLHIDSNHGFLKLDDEPGPTPSWEVPVSARRSPSFTQMNSIKSALPRTERNDPVLERNVNVSPIENKTDYKTQFSSNSLMTPPPQRQIITPYDATEDLRAKVKLVRHDLNEIKQSYLMNEERKDRVESKYAHNRNDNFVTPVPRKAEKFVTNLVPYEKNQSYKVNATPLDENPKNYYNYLGEKETPPKAFVPSTNNKQQRNIFFKELHNGEVEKTVTKTPVKTKISEDKKEHKTGERKEHKSGHSHHSRLLNEFPERSEHRKHSESKDGNAEHKPSHSEKKTEHKSEGGGTHISKTGAMPKKVSSPNGAVPKRTEQGAVPRRRKAPPPPVVIPKEEPVTAPVAFEDTDDVILPCEFCEEMIPASKLVQHETGCRPDLAQVKMEKPAAPIARPSLSPEVELPCEFCYTLFPASELLSHQELCDV